MEKEIDEVLNMIETSMQKGVSRLHIDVSEDLKDGTVENAYHHGRCDVGSPFAKGTVSNCESVDIF
ncbi:MAG: hypothetical protein K6F53_08030 [Lachnospiraceae bacterium]|nr:hypothetical protein [Lachnospiraceae bacterium]